MEREQWWKYSREFERKRLFSGTMPEPKPDRRTMATYRRIAEIHPTLGRRLDDSLAPQRVVKWIAWSPDRVECPRNVIQQLRFNAVMKVYAQCSQWPLQDGLRILADEIARATAWAPVVEPDPNELPAQEAAAAQEAQVSPPLADQDLDRLVTGLLGANHPNLANLIAAVRLASYK
jgi:hypothetical protein